MSPCKARQGCVFGDKNLDNYSGGSIIAHYN